MFVLVGTWVFEALCTSLLLWWLCHKLLNIEVENLLEQLPGWAGLGVLGKICYPWGVPHGEGIRNHLPWGGTSWLDLGSSWLVLAELPGAFGTFGSAGWALGTEESAELMLIIIILIFVWVGIKIWKCLKWYFVVLDLDVYYFLFILQF